MERPDYNDSIDIMNDEDFVCGHIKDLNKYINYLESQHKAVREGGESVYIVQYKCGCWTDAYPNFTERNQAFAELNRCRARDGDEYRMIKRTTTEKVIDV